MFQSICSVMRRLSPVAVNLACGSVALGASLTWAQPLQPKQVLTPCHVAGIQEELRCGTYEVFENRQTRRGRKLSLKIILIPARDAHPGEGPIFFLAGGPGETNTDFSNDFMTSTLRQRHDIVFVDSRGTGEGHRLICTMPRSDEKLTGYLKTPFAPEIARSCHRELATRFDLSQYSTTSMIDDLDDVRQALGYDKINLTGGSFGTYAALMYIRAHGSHVRSAYLASLVTLENRVPLYHAQAAQWALDRLFEQCEADAACRGAYPELRKHFLAVLGRLRRGPVSVLVRHPVTGVSTEIAFTEQAFADAMRVMMYSGERGREVPFLIEQAQAGHFDSLAESAMNSNRAFYANMPLGLYYAVTCNEFTDRIRPEEIESATGASYAGSGRVRDQTASCKAWPKTQLPANYFEPFRSAVPALLISGDTDPTTPPRWAEQVHSFLPNSVHLIVPGGHVPVSPCTNSIAEELFREGSIKILDTGCTAGLRPVPFKLPTVDPTGSAYRSAR